MQITGLSVIQLKCIFCDLRKIEIKTGAGRTSNLGTLHYLSTLHYRHLKSAFHNEYILLTHINIAQFMSQGHVRS